MRWVETHRFGDDLATENQPIDMGGGEGACADHIRYLVTSSLLAGLVLGQQPKRPGQRDRCGFVAGCDEGQKVVHDLGVAHAAAGFGIARREELIEKIRLVWRAAFR